MNPKLPGLWRYGLYFSVLLFFYGTLFPFNFDFSNAASSQFGLLPFWDAERSRIHSLPDMLSNALLTFPVGFFGFLRLGSGRDLLGVAKWFFFGFLMGLLSELMQLWLPSRLSGITDILNNGLGCFAGAVFASLVRPHTIDLLSGSPLQEKNSRFFILVGIATAGMLLPFDFTPDVSHIGSSLRQLWRNPWELGIPIQDEWIQMAVFAILGALAGSIKRTRLVLFAFSLPLILESIQLLIGSHTPSVRDLSLNLAGVAAGIAAALMFPSLVRPAPGFILMNVAILGQGLSPYCLGGISRFEWIPLVEYYNHTTSAALYDAMSGVLHYGLLAALWPRKTTILWAVLLAGGIEAAQVFLAARSAGVTDVVIAGIGAWAGYSIANAIERRRTPTDADGRGKSSGGL